MSYRPALQHLHHYLRTSQRSLLYSLGPNRRSRSSRCYKYSRPIPYQSGFSGSAFVLAVSAGFATAVIVVYQQLIAGPGDDKAIHERRTESSNRQPHMSELNSAGRPGHLTEHEAEKLREAWTALLHIFGIIAPDAKEPLINDQTAETATADTEKAGKRRKGLFGRKQNGKVESEGTKRPTMTGEDKYGLAAEYQKMLETQSPEQLRHAFWGMVKCDNPDGLLLRFLRARKWNVQDALVMLMATVNWRMNEMKVDDDIILKGDGGALEDSKHAVDAHVKSEAYDFLQQMRLAKSYLHGCDKAGRPMCFVRVRLHKQGEQSQQSLERYTVYMLETARLLLHGNVDTAAIIFDMTDFSLANMDYGPVKFMIKCFEANYPESLGVVLVHKSPWVFHGIWKIIKGWLDPVVASKVHFTKNIEEFTEFVDEDRIPAEMGGKENWHFEYEEPVDSEDATMKQTLIRDQLLAERVTVVKEYEDATQEWIQSPQNEKACARRSNLTESLRSGYWRLDPYIRARTVYDRQGIIKPGGHIDLYASSTTKMAPVQGGDDGGVD